MTTWDLSTRENWELILSESRIVQRQDPMNPQNLYEYTPISPIYSTPHSHILLIGTQSNSAKPHWFLGARASQYLYVSPSMNSAFISGVQASNTKKIGLNRLTLVEFKDYGVNPYTLQLKIPYWLEDIYIEVWEYQGNSNNVGQIYQDLALRLDSIEMQLDRIEQEINMNTGQ